MNSLLSFLPKWTPSRLAAFCFYISDFTESLQPDEFRESINREREPPLLAPNYRLCAQDGNIVGSGCRCFGTVHFDNLGSSRTAFWCGFWVRNCCSQIPHGGSYGLLLNGLPETKWTGCSLSLNNIPPVDWCYFLLFRMNRWKRNEG